ncbi:MULTISPECIES: DUF2937 family protein [Mameliella]|uniref:Prolyl-tRNA synthetase n=1 Tax=Mameliella alba TaxID=561184 RepID=A0A0B3RUG2_9RHOB|nr:MULTISPECIES: DUF2937 family protein [Mameliella]MCR9273653.1 DUF2937 family protein [Paracoccaceae bacterium]KHQ51737.1 Prolyl-tRNA synthetase [Mameliella alba]MBY6121051.1 DUF2937 family protein [Mameliella alba]OWV41975.1 hypothetical protein CDZ95_15565 [Mameliella alba]OWV47470.1 hypothetical protein CDZ96_13405 [Mameliella alba]
MFLRVLTLAAGLTGAAGLSQFPEYSQQYMQRLGGTVDELARQVTRYEGDAARVGMDLDAYLAALAEEGDMARTQAGNMASDIARHERLSAALARLEGAGPFMRAKLAFEVLPDSEVAARAFETYRPAVPATFEGAVFAGAGFLAGWAVLALGFAILRRSWRIMTAPLRGRGETPNRGEA